VPGTGNCVIVPLDVMRLTWPTPFAGVSSSHTHSAPSGPTVIEPYCTVTPPSASAGVYVVRVKPPIVIGTPEIVFATPTVTVLVPSEIETLHGPNAAAVAPEVTVAFAPLIDAAAIPEHPALGVAV
jgi:hypothetical protein